MITFSCFIDNLHVDTVAAQLAKCQKRFGLVLLVQDCLYCYHIVSLILLSVIEQIMYLNCQQKSVGFMPAAFDM